MSVLGLITEHNPFHNGHLHHLNQSKKITGCKFSVCVMSGNFIQRGEPALIDKWERARMAIKAGVDLVIELPTVYAMSTAELFAFGAVKILDALGVVDSICFGSESGSIDLLDKAASILIEEPEEFKTALKKHLNSGVVFPKARENALKEFSKNQDIAEVMKSSNNILGIEYLKALKKIGSSIKPYTISRVNNEYNESTLSGNISSATSIRKKLMESDIEAINSAVPKTTFEVLSENFSNGKGPVFSSNFDQMVIGAVRKASLNEIKNVFDVNEGLENRIKKAASKASSIDELIDLIKTKRYTQTRIQRILFHILLGINRQIYTELSKVGGPQYIRVLGFNENGRTILNEARKKTSLPIITKVANHINTGNALFDQMLQCDITATNLYTLAYRNPNYKTGNWDFTHEIVME